MTMRIKAIRVLVIDDSAFSRQAITRILDSSPLVEVVGTARDGEDALRKTLDLKPDLITLDLEMPRMDGFTYLRIVMAKRPTPIIVISGRAGEDDVFKALDLGAVDFIAKPTAHGLVELQSIEESLIRKVHSIRELRIDRVAERIQTAPPILTLPAPSDKPFAPVVVIGCSTGGPPALVRLFGAFTEAPTCTFLVAQHMPIGFTRGFAERLNRLTPLNVSEARGGEELKKGSVFIAPGGSHLVLEQVGSRVVTRVDSPTDSCRFIPSVDKLFASAAKHIGENLLAIVLTGMGDDGRKGACQVKEAGGRVIAESEETAVIYGMPNQVVLAGAADEILPLHKIPAAIQYGLGRNQARLSKDRE